MDRQPEATAPATNSEVVLTNSLRDNKVTEFMRPECGAGKFETQNEFNDGLTSRLLRMFGD